MPELGNPSLRRPSERPVAVVDSSVLINFLGLGRLDLLVARGHLAITEEVNAEILRHRTELDAAIGDGSIVVVSLMLDPPEAALFARLSRRLSLADASCIVLAARLGTVLAADDRTFRSEAAAIISAARVLGTENLLADAALAGLLSLADGDTLLARLPSLRYRPKVRSLREIIGMPDP